MRRPVPDAVSDTSMAVTIDRVQRFWNAHPCDGHRSRKPRGSLEFFREISAARYRHEWHIPAVARFECYRGKRVLEIGCGIGVDGAQFAGQGARYTGVDLTAESVCHTAQHLRLKGLAGRVMQANAERLPLAEASFDHVYSYGVIHHSPRTDRVVREIYRVLAPGGTFCVMVYHRDSINYWVEIMILRRMLRYLLAPAWAPAVLAVITGFDQDKLRRQREVFLSAAARDSARWVSMNTDGPDCPLAKVYTRRTARRLFADFADVRCRAFFFDKSHYPLIGRLIPRAVERLLGRAFGWHLVVTGRKPYERKHVRC